MAIKPASIWLAQNGWTGVSRLHLPFLEPQGEAGLGEYLDAGWSEADVKDYLKAYYETFFADTFLPYLGFGSFEYWDI